ncbi:hypothetical protein EGW08_008149 [Elysia chlorotica]|uniref:Ig-like domain-containing protein n=1 Tax=Elysia chlorotica TaxID=188477 RepID=A0A433TRF3_ELYCH|nr:hypothetical protein EGW08_008149 [Elysia chlorotica]
MRRLFQHWIIAMSLASILMMAPLASLQANADDKLAAHKGRLSSLSKNSWRLKRRRAREPDPQDTLYKRNHAYRSQDTPSLPDTPPGFNPDQAKPQDRHKGHQKDTYRSVPLRVALPLSSIGDLSSRDRSVPVALPLSSGGDLSSRDRSVPVALPLSSGGDLSSRDRSVPVALPLSSGGDLSSRDRSVPVALPLSSGGDLSSRDRSVPVALPLSSGCDPPDQPTPQFVFFQPVVTVRPHSLATLPCSVRNLGDRQVVWRQVDEDKFLTIGRTLWSHDDPRILVEHRDEGDGVSAWDLLIKSVNQSDAGTYQCQVTSSEGVMMDVQLRVEEPATTEQPKMTILRKVTHRDFRNTRNDAADEQRLPQREEHLTAGMPIRLQCNTSVEHLSTAWKTQMHWYKEGYALNPSKHTLITW